MDTEWKGRTLGSILFDSRMIGQAEIERALDEQKRSGVRFGEALVKLGLVSREDVSWGLSQQLNIPFVHIRNELIDAEAVHAVPEETARRHHALPYLLIGDELTILIEDPTDQRAAAEIAEITGKRVGVGIALAEEISMALDSIYGPAGERQYVEDLQSGLFEPARIDAMTADPTGGQFIEGLLHAAIDCHAASVHFEMQRADVEVRFRVGGVMRPAATLSRAWMHLINRRLKSMLTQTDRRTGMLDGLLRLPQTDRDLCFHGSFVDTTHGEEIVLANLDTPEIGETLDELALDAESKQALEKLLASPRGLILLTGPEGPAKNKFLRLLADAPPLRDRKRAAVGRLPHLVDADMIRLSYPADRTPLEALAAGVALDSDVLVVEDLLDRALLFAVLKEAAGARLALGAVRLATLQSGVEYLLESAESRVLLCEALRGLASLHLVRALTPENSEPDDRRKFAARALRLTPTAARAAEFRRAVAPPGLADRWLPLVGVLPWGASLTALAKSGASTAKIVAAHLASGPPGLAARARELAISGRISVEDYLAATGSHDGPA